MLQKFGSNPSITCTLQFQSILSQATQCPYSSVNHFRLQFNKVSIIKRWKMEMITYIFFFMRWIRVPCYLNWMPCAMMFSTCSVRVLSSRCHGLGIMPCGLWIGVLKRLCLELKIEFIYLFILYIYFMRPHRVKCLSHIE